MRSSMGLCVSRPIVSQAQTLPYRHAVITGASSGIGAAVALQLASIPGMCLTLVARNPARLAAVKAGCMAQGSKVEMVCLDITDEAALATALQQAHKRQPIDLVIANAGIVASALQPDSKAGASGCDNLASMLREAGNTNIMGTLNTLGAALPLLKATAASGRPAAAAIMSSVSVLPHDAVQFTGQLQMGLLPYAWSKQALLTLGQGLQGELEGSGVAVFTICPGVVLTQLATDLTHSFMGQGGSANPPTTAAAQAADNGTTSVAVARAGQQVSDSGSDGRPASGMLQQLWQALAKGVPTTAGREGGAVSVSAGPVFACSASEDTSEPQTPRSSISMAAFAASRSPPASPALQGTQCQAGSCVAASTLPVAQSPAATGKGSALSNTGGAHATTPSAAAAQRSHIQPMAGADTVSLTSDVAAQHELKKRLKAITPEDAAAYICNGLAAGKGGLIAFPAAAVRTMKIMALLPQKFLVKSIKRGVAKYNAASNHFAK